MVGGSTAATPMAHGGNSYHQCTPRASGAGTSHFTQQSILGAFTASSQTSTPAQKSYAKAAQHGPKVKDTLKPAQTLSTPQPTQLSRKRADPQSDPKPTLALANNKQLVHNLLPPPLDS